jgi:glutaredoxin
MQTKSNRYSTAQVWSQPNCPACDEAKRLLELHQIPFAVCELGQPGYTKKELLDMVPNARSVPQVFLNGFHDKRIKME